MNRFGKVFRGLAALLLALMLLAADGFTAPERASAAGAVRTEAVRLLAKGGKNNNNKKNNNNQNNNNNRNNNNKNGNGSGGSGKTEQPAAMPTPEGKPTATPVPEGPIIDPQSIADYLFANGRLPDNFITKKEAQELGWGTRYKYVSDAAPGMSIGGDRFGNYEELLPVVKGRKYFEADCWYSGGPRNACRIIYSSDGHVWYTEDHYESFTELFPTGSAESP